MATTLTTSYKLVGSVTSGTYSILRLYGKYTSQSTTNNTSSVTFQLRLYGNGGSGSFTSGTAKINGSSTSLGSTSFSNGSETTLATKTFTFTHDDDGTLTKSISYSVTSTYAAAASGSGTASVTLPTIARTSVPTLSASSITLGSTLKITTNRKSSDFTHSIYYSIGSISSQLLASSVTTSYSWTLPLSLATEITSDVSATVTLKVVTYNGSTQIGYKTITFIATIPDTEEFYPTIDSITLSEATENFPEEITSYVQSISQITGEITASGVYDSTISSYSVSINGESFTSSSFTTSVLSSSDVTLSVSIKDSRGRTTTSEEEVDVLSYEAPTFSNVSISRDESDEANINLVFDCTIYNLNNLNTPAFKLYYGQDDKYSSTKISTDNMKVTTTGTTTIYSINANVIELSEDSSYVLYVEATDLFNTITTGTYPVLSSFKLINIGADKSSMAIGKYSEVEDSFEVNLETIIYNNAYLSEAVDEEKYPILAYRVSGNTEPLSYVVVNYVDEDGNTLADSVTLSDYVGENYTTTATEIEGYEVSDVDGITKGTYTEDTITVTYIYSRLTSSVVVNYVDEDGNTLADSITLTGYVGDSYTIDDISEMAYGLVDDEEILTGTYTEESQEVTLTYHVYSYTLTYTGYDSEGNETDGTLVFDELETFADDVLDSVDIDDIDSSMLNEGSLGAYLYNNCGSFSTIAISSINNSSPSNTFYLFGSQVILESVDLDINISSTTTNMAYMFYECDSLSSITISDLNTSFVTDMSYMFYDCSSLTGLDFINQLDTSSVTDMSYMFYNCSSLTELDLSHFVTSSVVDNGMEYMFYNCTKLKSLDVSNFNTNSITSTYYMFCQCISLTSLDLSSFDTSSVTDMSGTFCRCTALTTLDISNFDFTNLTMASQYTQMFVFCTSLTTIYVKDETAQTWVESHCSYGSVIIKESA